MKMQPESTSDFATRPEAASYEAPRIENILQPEDMEREVAYAGVGSGPF